MTSAPISDVAIFHDYFAQLDGGGKLCLALASETGWPLVTGSLARGLGVRRQWPRVHVDALGYTVPHALLRILQQVRLWRNYRSPYQRIVYSGHYAPLAAANHPEAPGFYYCHTPPRFIFDQAEFWLHSLPIPYRAPARTFVRWFRGEYENAVRRIPRIVANSQNVQRRIATYLGRDSEIVHPPCDVASFTWKSDQGYYLSTARLDPIKRVDHVVAAFRRLPDKRLIVTSDGPSRRRLVRMARDAPNIEFTGPVSESRLRELISACIATIYVPVDEDFGMSPVESMASGKPVIGVAEGGILETVTHGECGWLVPEGAPVDALVDAIESMPATRARQMRDACLRRAENFDLESFTARIRNLVTDL